MDDKIKKLSEMFSQCVVVDNRQSITIDFQEVMRNLQIVDKNGSGEQNRPKEIGMDLDSRQVTIEKQASALDLIKAGSVDSDDIVRRELQLVALLPPGVSNGSRGLLTQQRTYVLDMLRGGLDSNKISVKLLECLPSCINFLFRGDPINCTMVEEIMRFSSLKMAAETTTVNENSSEVKVALKLLAQMVLMKPCRLIGTKRKNSYNVFDGCSSSKSARVTDPVPKFVGRFDGAALAGSLNIQDFKAGGSTGPISSRLKYKLNKPPAWRPQLQFSSNQKDITEGREWLRACEAQGNHFQLNVQRSLCPSNMNGPPHGSVSYFHHAQEFALSGTPELFRFVARQASGPEAKVTELPSELSKPQND